VSAYQACLHLATLLLPHCVPHIALALDKGNSDTVPTISISSADADDDAKQPKAAGNSLKPSNPKPEASSPGAMPNGSAPQIPDWYIAGWRAASGIDKPPLEEGEEKDKSVLDVFLSEQFYGQWYHNAALVVFVCITRANHKPMS